MSPDDYVYSVIQKYNLPDGPEAPTARVLPELKRPIAAWASKYLMDIKETGSIVKGTRVRGSTEVDILISLGPRTPGSLERIFDSLFACLKAKGMSPRKKSVSIGIDFSGMHVDLIPAKLQWGTSNDHALFETERRREARTNFDTHARYVQESKRVGEIKATKIWRNLRDLRFPSFYLELTVIAALRNAPAGQPAQNLSTVFHYLRDNLVGTPVFDPANPENAVSDELSEHEQMAIADAAAETLHEKDWRRIIW